MGLQFIVLSARFAICQLKQDEPLPTWVYQSSFYSISKTSDELSVICEEQLASKDIKKSVGWRLLKINAELDLSLIGITARFSTALANAGVNLSVIATYNTDYILVEEAKLEIAIHALKNAGFDIGK